MQDGMTHGTAGNVHGMDTIIADGTEVGTLTGGTITNITWDTIDLESSQTTTEERRTYTPSLVTRQDPTSSVQDREYQETA